jgi:hypothetical protein
MTTQTVYWWQQTYDAAVLEMDLAEVPGRVATALKAIEERLRSCIEYGGVEHLAIVDARRALAILKAVRR